MWAIVPAKEFAAAKQRLSSVLTELERASLFAEMLDEVIATLLASKGISGIVLVTNEPRADFYAGIIGVRIVPDRVGRGQSAAVRQGARFASSLGARGILTVPGDVPLVSPAEIELILAVHDNALAAGSGAVVIVPSRDGKGTNGLCVSPPDLIDFHFGDASFEPHCAAARAAGIEPRILRLPGLGLDVDTPDDLAAFRARESVVT